MLQQSKVKINKYLVWATSAVLAIPIIQLIPLPAAIWDDLPGRDIIIAIDQSALNSDNWRQLSLVPQSTSNSLYALFVPLAVMGLAIQLNRDERHLLLPILLSLGLFSGFTGVLQAVGNENGPLYFYNVTNNGAAVGIFANRNHQAVLLSCLFPMLTVFASVRGGAAGESELKKLISTGAGIILVPLILITGSRAGLLLGLAGLGSVVLLSRKSTQGNASKKAVSHPLTYPALGGLAVIALTATTVFFSRGLAIARLTQDGTREDIWRKVFEVGSHYNPVGTGVGTFATIHQLHESTETLTGVYINQAHNEFLDLYLTSSLFIPAFLLLIATALIRAACRGRLIISNSRTDLLFSRLGATILFIILIGSIADYPLRTPIIIAVCSIALVWLLPNSGPKSEKSGSM